MRRALLVFVAVLLMLPVGALADTINLGGTSLGTFTFTGNGSEGFSSVSWSGWIGTATGPGALSGDYSIQSEGGGFSAGAPITDTTVEAWNLAGYGAPTTLCYNDSVADLCTATGQYLFSNLTWTILSGGFGFYTVQGSLVNTAGSLASQFGSGNVAVLFDVNPNTDLSELSEGQTATAGISTGEIVVPEPKTTALLGFGLLGLVGLMGSRRKKLLLP